MKCQEGCFQQRGYSMQIFNSPALQVGHEKVKKFSKMKMKITRTFEVILQLRKKLIRTGHGCRYSVESDKWADCGTVLVGMRAVIEVQIWKKKAQCSKAERQKSEMKKCYYSSETNSSGLCIVAGAQLHHKNDLTVVPSLPAWQLSSKVQIWKKKKKKNSNTTEQGKKETQKLRTDAPQDSWVMCISCWSHQWI